MELSNYIKLLLKHKYTLIIIPLIAIVITYFLVRNQPDTYSSTSQIATGIVDQTQQSLSQQLLQDSKIAQEFSNLIELTRSKKILDQVSYLLMIHDLTAPRPFRKPSKLLRSLNTSARNHALSVYKDLYNKHESLSLFNPDQQGLYTLMQSMKYDDQSLLRILIIYRSESSDFITVECDSDDPQLTAFVVNTLCREMIDYYNSILKENQHKAVNFLGGLLKAKQDSMAKRMEDLKQYKIQNHVFNLNEQARALYSEISSVETKLEDARKDAVSLEAAIHNIDSQFDPADRRYVESSMVRLNAEIVNTRARLESLNNKYVQSGFDPQYKLKSDSLMHVLTGQVLQSLDKYSTNPLTSKQNLIQQKLNLQIQYDLAKNSIGSLQNQLVSLNDRLHSLVPHEAVVQADENAISVASQEYLDILQKYNQTSLESNFSARLRQVDTAMPGAALPSKKMLLVILSGIISFVFCMAVLFVLFLMDTTVKTPRELANKTKVPVIGYVNTLQGASIDLNKVWSSNEVDSDTALFKSLLQSIRFEVDRELGDEKTLLINSMTAGEGKTYVAMNLAYAHAAVNKHVLVIDGNFVKPSISELVKPKQHLEDYLSGALTTSEINGSSRIQVLGNKGVNGSILELGTESAIKEKIDALKQYFDLIIIEAPALDQLNKSKEWTLFCDKILTVFEANQSIKDFQKASIQYLKSFNNKFTGWVMNMVGKDQLVNAAKS